MNGKKEGLDLKSFFEILRRYIVVIICVVAASAAVGTAAAYLRKPSYTASELVNYVAIIEGDTTATKNNSAMTTYLATVVDFCDTGIVVDRANYYYEKYLEEYAAQGKTLGEFIESVRENDDYEEKLAAGNATAREKYISAGNIKSVHNDDETVSVYSFTVSLTDGNETGAREKLRVLILAYDLELRSYFTGLKTYVNETVENERDVAVKADVSKTKIILLSVLVGVVLAVAAAYLLYVSDGTIRSKEELERLTGTKLLGCVRKTGEKA